MKFAGPLFALACLAACSAGEQAPEPVVIAKIKTHDAKVSILGGRAGDELRVTVRKDDGTLVAENVTLDALRAKDEDAWRIVTSAYAHGDGTYLDATYR